MTDPDEWGISTAIAGLRTAHDRFVHAHRDQVPRHEEAAVAAIDFTNWACALDELLRTTDPDYGADRDADKNGRYLNGLRFVRDRHMHQVAMAPGMVFHFAFDADRQPKGLRGVDVYWRDLDDIRSPTGWHSTKPEYKRRRDAYREDLQGQPCHVSLDAVHRYLREALVVRGLASHVQN